MFFLPSIHEILVWFKLIYLLTTCIGMPFTSVEKKEKKKIIWSIDNSSPTASFIHVFSFSFNSPDFNQNPSK